MRTFTASAVREGRTWVVTVPRVGVTQARSLREAQDMAEDLVVAMLELKRSQFRVVLEPVLDRRLRAAVAAARKASAQLEDQRREASRRSRVAVHELVEIGGLSGRDAAVVLGVSPQRISQLLAD